ncbi:MAG: TolC family protein, partial [Alcaligenaceae bacterium]
WQIGPSLSLPIFDQGRRRSVITLRQLEQQEAAVAFQQTVLKAWQEIDDALTGYSAERRKNAALHARLASAEQTWALARAQYTNGLITYLPQLDAERNLLQVRRDMTQSNYRLFTALVAVYKSVGGAEADKH